MNETEIVEFKEGLNEFENTIKADIKDDPEYAGEADNLLNAVARLKKDFESIHTAEDFDKKIGSFAKDFMAVQEAAEMMADFDDEDCDFDFDDEEEVDDEDLAFAEEEEV